MTVLLEFSVQTISKLFSFLTSFSQEIRGWEKDGRGRERKRGGVGERERERDGLRRKCQSFNMVKFAS